MKRLLALVVCLFALAGGEATAAELRPAWVFSGAYADDYFGANPNGYGICTESGHIVSCAAHLSTSRVSAETCQWADGHLSYAAANVPCITDLGLGIRESRTNLARQSNALTTTPWVVGANLALTQPGTIIAPDGTLTAWDAVTSGAANTLTQPIVTVALGTYPTSIYIQPVSGSGSVVFGNLVSGCQATYTQSGTSLVYASQAAVGAGTCVGTSGLTGPSITGWYRLFVVGAPVGVSGGISLTLPNPSTVNLFGADQDPQAAAGGGTFVTPYISTTSGTVVRAADSISTVPGSVLDNALRATPGSMLIQTNSVNYVANSNTLLRFSGNWYARTGGTVNGLYSSDGTNGYSLNPSSGNITTRAKISYAYNGATITGAWNGHAVAPGTNVRTTATGTISVGSAAGTGSFLNGYIERLAVVPYSAVLLPTYP
jgi:hypothetical protein